MDRQGFVEPEDENYPYFPLRDGPIESAIRASYWLDPPIIKDMVICRIIFTAVGVATLFPSVLTVQPGTEQTRYRLNGNLHSSFKSADNELLYAIAEERMQIV